MTVQEDQEVGFKSSKLFGGVCCWCWKRLFPASEKHEGQGEGNCFVRQRESGDNLGAPCWAAHGSCWESWLIARLIFFEHPKGFTLIHFPAVSRALCSNVQSTAHLHVRFGFHAVFNLLVRYTCAYLWGIWHCLSMFVILWCFCAQARCKLFPRLGDLEEGLMYCRWSASATKDHREGWTEGKPSNAGWFAAETGGWVEQERSRDAWPKWLLCFDFVLFVLFHLITPAFSSFDSVKNLCNDTVSHVVRCNIQGSSTYGPSGVNSKRRGIQRYL